MLTTAQSKCSLIKPNESLGGRIKVIGFVSDIKHKRTSPKLSFDFDQEASVQRNKYMYIGGFHRGNENSRTYACLLGRQNPLSAKIQDNCSIYG